MRQQRINAELKGLITNGGELVRSPGCFDVCDNVDLVAPGVLQPRRAIMNVEEPKDWWQHLVIDKASQNPIFNLFSTAFWGQNNSANRGTWMVAHRGASGPTKLTSIRSGGGGSMGAGVLNDMPTPDGVNFTPPAEPGVGWARKPRLASHNKNAIIAGAPVPVRIEMSDNSTAMEGNGHVSWAGLARPRGQHPRYFLGSNPILNADSGSTGASIYWLEDNEAVAYRHTFLFKDKQGVWRESPPSSRWVVVNSSEYSGYDSGEPAYPNVYLQLPCMTNTQNLLANTQSNAFGPVRVRLYRTFKTTLPVLPAEEYYQCYEADVVAADYSAGYITITDTTPEAGFGATAYFNSLEGGDIGTGLVMPAQTSLGLAAENTRPPYAMDIATFQRCMFYGGLTPPMSMTISLISTGTTAGTLQNADTLTMVTNAGTKVYVASNGPATPLEFALFTTNPVMSWNVRRTVEAFIAVFNDQQGDAVATYVGDPFQPDTNGKIYFECTRTQDSLLRLTCSVANPAFIFPRYTTPASSRWDGEKLPNWNGIAVSKPGQPDAVPPVNYALVGGNENRVLRLLSTSDGLFIILERGVWVCTGGDITKFNFEEYAPGLQLFGPENACVHGDHVYGWFRQGIFRFSVRGGIERLDMPVKSYVDSVLAAQNFGAVAYSFQSGWAFSVPETNSVQFWWPTGNIGAQDGMLPGQTRRALVWHGDTNAWTTYSTMATRIEGVRYVSYRDAVRTPGSGALFYVPGTWSEAPNQYLLSVDPDPWTLPYVSDTDYVGALVNWSQSLRWQAVIANPHGLTHWSEFEYYTQPGRTGFEGTPVVAQGSTCFVNMYTDITGASNPTGQNVTRPGLAYTGRCLIPRTQSLGTRFTVEIISNAWQAFNGFSLLYRPIAPGTNTK